jgi:hypothetical protein
MNKTSELIKIAQTLASETPEFTALRGMARVIRLPQPVCMPRRLSIGSLINKIN